MQLSQRRSICRNLTTFLPGFISFSDISLVLTLSLLA
jgi:hypothetical protein